MKGASILKYDFMKSKFLFFFVIILFSVVPAQAQKSAKKLKTSAENYYKRNKYAEAYNLFAKYTRLKSPDADIMYKMGIAAYQSNRLPESIRHFQSIINNEKKPDQSVYYGLARAYHQQRKYKEAILNYKKYLKNTKFDDRRREHVKDNILRCASGLNLSYVDEQAVVENMGSKVNSEADDFGPVLSPNYNNKLYFSSNRKGSIGGKRNAEGYPDEQYGNYSTDIYSSIIINGEWTSTTPLPSLINSVRNEILLDFNDDGQVLFYYKGLKMSGGEALVDSFNNDQKNELYAPKMDTPMVAEKGDESPYYFNDSIMLFSSNRHGGLGGKDIYVSTRTNGYWTVPKNLGMTINSHYDEVSPFLSMDGRTLYFSSNRPESIGGMDIYRARYNDGKQAWETPENMVWPVNSPANDRDFRLSPNGLEGYFASDRKSGNGGLDLFTAYFKSQLYEQSVSSNPLVFTQVPVYRRQQQTSGVVFETSENVPTKSYPSTVNFPESATKVVEVNPINYRNDDDILSTDNLEKINEVIRIMNEYPQLKVMLTAHSDGSDPVEFDLFFSIKRAEKVAAYLQEKGINASNIHLKGVGAVNPAATQETEGGTSVMAQKINRRIDFEIFNSAGLPLQIVNKGPVVSKFLKDQRGIMYNQEVKGLSYKIQIASLAQRYKGSILLEYRQPLIESVFNKNYKYSVGLFQNFYGAEQLRKELVARGITDAFVIPYINGVRASLSDSKIYAAAYPDLLNFLAQTNQD